MLAEILAGRMARFPARFAAIDPLRRWTLRLSTRPETLMTASTVVVRLLAAAAVAFATLAHADLGFPDYA